MTVVLDSWAILRFLEGREPTAGLVSALLAAERPVVSWINVGEVFYILRRATNEADAIAVVHDLGDIVTRELPDANRVLEAARIKAEYPLAYADAFAAATALAHGGDLWTGDPELLIDGARWRWRDVR